MKTARPRKIETEYHSVFLKAFDRNEKYVYVILFPNEFNKKFVEAYPNGRLFQFSEAWSVFAN
jgi:hypothetical protein